VAFHYKTSREAAIQACQEATTHGVKAIAIQADVTNPDQAKSLIEQVSEQLGGLSVIVNNVGNYLEKPINEVSVEEWHQVIDSNLNATFYLCKAAIPYLKVAGWGRIVNIGSSSAQNLIARPESTPYIIAKTGILIYSKSLAKELIQHQITVNVVSPGVAENSVGLEETIPILPARRPATLKEISNAVCFFISPEADYITGQVLEVAGGWRL
jgi:NAD(P)-dependent dehydrogenase (short-subunit alcohol dehydrogenase family)